MKRLSPLALLLLPIYVFAQPLPGKTPADEWKTFENEKIYIAYPGDWELKENVQMGVSFALLSPITNADDKFRENINLVEQDIAQYNLDLDQYKDVSLGQVKNLMADFALVESTKMKSKNPIYYKVVYTCKQGAYDLRIMQYYFVIKNRAYVLTFTTPQTTFDHYKAVGESVMNSFKIKE